MAFRRIEIHLPSGVSFDLDELVRNSEVIRQRVEECDDANGDGKNDGKNDGGCMITLDVREDAAELVLDSLSEHYGDTENFYATVFEVSAILPHPPDPDDQNDNDDSENDPDGDQANDPDAQEWQQRKALARQRISRDELIGDLSDGARINKIYLITVALSTVVAAVGLIRNSVAMVVGAMVIAPLLIPNMALALSATLGDLKLARRAVLSNTAGLALALVLAILVGITIDIDVTVHEIESRTQASYSDVAVALAAGAAGAIAVTTGVSANLIGVMVAVALLPPLVALGLLLGTGHYPQAIGAALLLGTNVVSINLAGVLVFLLQGLRPTGWSNTERAKKSVILSIIVWSGMLGLLVLLIYLAGPNGMDWM